MSRFTPYPIEDITTWNEVLDRGVPAEQMPVPSTPYFYADYISARAATFAFFVTPTYYATKNLDWADGGYEYTTYTTPRSCYFFNSGPTVTSPVSSFTEGTPKTGTRTDTYTDVLDVSANVATGFDEIEAYGIDWGTLPFGSGNGPFGGVLMTSVVTERVIDGAVGDIGWTRIRWRVPIDYVGTYFKIKWEYYFVPTTGDPSILGEDEFIWSGPGNPNDEMDASWFSDYFYIDPPSGYGSVYLKNFQLYNLSSSPYGVRPLQSLMLIQPGETVMDMSKAANSMYQPLI